MARIVFGDIKECWRQQVLTFTAHGGELRLSRNEVTSQLFGSAGNHLSGSAAAGVRIAPASNFAASGTLSATKCLIRCLCGASSQ